jgi:hypothetical protein
VEAMPAPFDYVFTPLSAEERWALERFVSRVDRLRGSQFAASQSGLRATLLPGATVLGGLYTDSNNASAAKVAAILKRRAYERGTDASRQMIDRLRELGAALRKRRVEDPWGKVLEEDQSGALVERSPEDIINTWFNGEYFHDEPELAAELAPDGHGAVEMMRLSLHMAMRDYIRYWSTLRDLVEKVLADPSLRRSA